MKNLNTGQATAVSVTLNLSTIEALVHKMLK
jgi:hypothetical protein